MLALCQRKRPPVAAPSPAPATDLPKGLLRPESAASLLATPRRQKLLEHIWQRTSLSRRQFATLYRFHYRDDREYRLHSAATGLLYRQLLDRDALDWLSGYPDLWGPLLYVLAGQYEDAGVPVLAGQAVEQRAPTVGIATEPVPGLTA